jgi:hypothetical protein
VALEALDFRELAAEALAEIMLALGQGVKLGRSAVLEALAALVEIPYREIL